MRRARSMEDKAERRGAILDAAMAAYEAEPSFAAFTMSALAERSGLAKGTLYLYFRTKEELFLALVERMLQEWFDEIDGRLDRARGEWMAAGAADALLDTIRGRESLARLLSILPTIVEHNVDAAAALRFKRGVLERATSTGARLERRLPWLRPGEGARLLVHLHAMVIGVWQLADPSPVMERVLREPGMEAARVEFGRDLRDVLRLLLRGMQAEAAERG